MSDRVSTLFPNEYRSHRNEAYSTLYKRLQPEQGKQSLKPSSAINYDTSKVNHPAVARTSKIVQESPQVQLHSVGDLTSEKKSDPVIRADLFGKYQTINYGQPEFIPSNIISDRTMSQQVTFQNKSTSQLGQTKQSFTDEVAKAYTGGMSWTGQYGHFIRQIERMKQELENIGDENLELANLITEA